MCVLQLVGVARNEFRHFLIMNNLRFEASVCAWGKLDNYGSVVL